MVREREAKKTLGMDKFRLRMTSFLYTALQLDATVVNKWLRFSIERSMKELDISLRVDKS